MTAPFPGWVRSGVSIQVAAGVVPKRERKCLDLKVDARYLIAAFRLAKTSALAQFGELDMTGLVQFHSRGNQHTVDVKAASPLEFKQ